MSAHLPLIRLSDHPLRNYPPNEIDRLLALCVPRHLNGVLPPRVNDDGGAAYLRTVQRTSRAGLDYLDLLDVRGVDAPPCHGPVDHDPIDYYQRRLGTHCQRRLGNLRAAYGDCRCRNRWRRRRDQGVGASVQWRDGDEHEKNEAHGYDTVSSGPATRKFE